MHHLYASMICIMDTCVGVKDEVKQARRAQSRPVGLPARSRALRARKLFEYLAISWHLLKISACWESLLCSEQRVSEHFITNMIVHNTANVTSFVLWNYKGRIGNKIIGTQRCSVGVSHGTGRGSWGGGVSKLIEWFVIYVCNIYIEITKLWCSFKGTERIL